MADKEPRRRKKRKDSVKKDDMRSEEPIFIPTRSESKDSDQEAEEEISAIIHQPSSFAKFVFIILFSGLVVSMSFIFISLHGTERGEVDMFDDHHSEEQLYSESTDQIDNSSSTDYSEDTENLSPSEEAPEEMETWVADLLPENFRNMLPDIKNVLSFNNEEDKVSSDINADSSNDLHDEENEETISQLSEIFTVTTNEDEFNIDDNVIKIVDEKEEDISTDSTSNFNFDQTPEKKMDQDEELQYSETDYTQPAVQESNDYYSEMYEAVSEGTDSDQLSYSQLEQSANPTFSEVVIESATEIFNEDTIFSPVTNRNEDSIVNEEDSIKNEKKYIINEEESFRNQEESIRNEEDPLVNQDSLETSKYDESDSYMYEKQFITNEEDYVIREQLDLLESMIDKNLPDDKKDEKEDDEEEDNDKIEEDEFDFWQF